MTVSELLRALAAQGLELRFEGEQLRFRAPKGALRPEQRAEIAARRAEVLAQLRADAAQQVEVAPLSHSQRSLWFVWQEGPGSPAYNVAMAARVLSTVNVPALRQALQALVDRHAVLRTAYPLIEGMPVQRVVGYMPVEFAVHDVDGMADSDLQQRVADDYARPFDVTAGAVFRGSLFSRASTDHVLLLTVHHIAVDGWSLFQLLDEFRALYCEATGGAPAAIARPEAKYTDFARSQADTLAGPEGQRLADYWRGQLAAPRAEVELPADRRRERRCTRGKTHAFEIDATLSEKLRQLARDEGTTLFVVLLATFKTLLYRYTGTGDLIVGTPTFGRNRPEFARVVGDFVNTIALRSRLDADLSFRELLAKLRQTVIEGLDAQDYPFPLVVEQLQPERDPARSPLFETLFVLQRFDQFRELEPVLIPGEGSVNFGGLTLAHYPLLQQEGQFDLTLQVVDRSAALTMQFKYNPALYDPSTMARLAGHFQTLAAAAVAGPERPIGQLPLLPADERRDLIARAGITVASTDASRTFHERFEEQVTRNPDAIAVSADGGTLSYGDLNRRANRVAHRLRSMGVGPDTLVGLCCERSVDMVVGLVAILKAGGAYLPIDSSCPADRIAFMLEDAHSPVLLSQRGLEGQLPAHRGHTLFVDDPYDDQPDGNPPPASGSDNLVSVIYNSESTGRPKGTMLTHRAVQRLFTSTDAWYGFGPEDVWTLFHSVAFDFSVWEIWGALLYGGRLVVVPDSVSRTPDAFLELLRDEGVTVLNQTPSTFGQLMQADWSGPRRPTRLRYVIFGGETLELPRLRPWFERYGDEQPMLVHMYGITEACVHVTYRPIRLVDLEPGAGSVIGEPIPDLRLHVLDGAMEPMPLGVAGEMYVGGPGLARGYLDRPELTAARFVSDPFVAGERLYRTGDLARRRASGELEYLGRIDRQVNVRGVRVDLGEIEAQLADCETVRQSAVIVREDKPGDSRLVAYLVSPDPASVTAIRAQLSAALPDYMVPSAFVFLDALPLASNGKIDRAALPTPAAHGERRQFVAPGSPTEHTTSACQHVAVLREMGSEGECRVSDSRFSDREEGTSSDRSGQSPLEALFDLLAKRDIRLLLDGDRVRVNAPKGALDESVKALIASRKEEIVAALRAGKDAAAAQETRTTPIIPTLSRSGPLPVSSAQQRLWFFDRLDPGRLEYNVGLGVRLIGRLDERRLSQAIDLMIARHESLRIRLVESDGAPVAELVKVESGALSSVDLSALEPTAREPAIRRLLEDELRTPFQLKKGPLARFQLVRVSPDDHVLLVTMHHVVSDGWSMMLAVNEAWALYEMLAASEIPNLPPLPVQYADYAGWERDRIQAGHMAGHCEYWKQRLAGVPALLELPVDRPRPAAQSFQGARLERRFAASLPASLRERSRVEGVTPFMTLLAALQVLLCRVSGQDDILVGTPVANRSMPGLESVIGCLVNNVVLRGTVNAGATFRDYLADVKRHTVDAFDHSELPFDVLVEALNPERSASHSPLFQVLFTYMSFPTQINAPAGLKAQMIGADTGTARFDLTIELAELDGELNVRYEYATGLFDEATIARLHSHYETLLTAIAADPSRTIGELPLLTPAEEQSLLTHVNDTRLEHDRTRLVHQLLEETARVRPDATAVSDGDRTLTYAELDRRANQLAHLLVRGGVSTGALVGVCLDRTVDMPVALAAVLKAGAAYVPLDPAHPAERIRYSLEDAGASCVITHARFVEHIGGGNVATLALDELEPLLACQLATPPESAATPADLAYVIYTSGSTGRPKGVQVEHRNVVSFLEAMRREPGLDASDVLLAVTTLSFDIAGLEMWLPLMVGARIVIASRTDVLDGRRLADLMDAQRVSLFQATPATWRLLLEAGWRGRPGLKALCGGEALPRDLAALLLDRVGELWNMYGPTETTIWSTVHRVRNLEGAIPVGRAIANTRVYVLEPSGLVAPIGVAGELCIAGEGVARGYRNRPELTAEKFTTIRLPNGTDERIYRTGDLVRTRADGTLEYLGRGDTQVKVRGYRIELGEIESVLATYPGVKECVVIVREDDPSDQRLVAYLVLMPGSCLDPDAVRSTLRAKLPEYMVPTLFEVLEALPLTGNGKIARKRLPRPQTNKPAAEAATTIASDVLMTAPQRRVASVWREVLRTSRVGLQDNFFDLGGHSLLLVKLQAGLTREFGRELPLVELFQRTTVSAQAARLSLTTVESDAVQRARARAEKQVHV